MLQEHSIPLSKLTIYETLRDQRLLVTAIAAMLWWRRSELVGALYTLKYSSTLTASPAEADTILATVLACALRNNPSLGITGMMYYDRSTLGLVQVLEGPKAAVEGLYTKICADDRCARTRQHAHPGAVRTPRAFTCHPPPCAQARRYHAARAAGDRCTRAHRLWDGARARRRRRADA